MNLQKKLAAKVMKCGVNKVWIDPKNEKVKQAITRRDIRRFIKEGIIKKIPAKKKKKLKAKKQQKTGSRKGTWKTRLGKKTRWLKVVRPQRKLLRELKSDKKINVNVYRKTYRLIKGNQFRSKAHLLTYLRERDLMEEKQVK